MIKLEKLIHVVKNSKIRSLGSIIFFYLHMHALCKRIFHRIKCVHSFPADVNWDGFVGMNILLLCRMTDLKPNFHDTLVPLKYIPKYTCFLR